MSFVVNALLNFLLKFRRHEEFLRRIVVFDVKKIRLAANLAVLYIHLAAAGGFIHHCGVPLSARGALETGLHNCNEHTL